MPRYLDLAEIIAFHRLVMESTGSEPTALRDTGLLASAIMRPRSAAHYEGADLLRQAVLLAVGISQAQAFVDGNKRTAYSACIGFLRLNRVTFLGDPLELAQHLEKIAIETENRDVTIANFEKWLRESTGPLSE